MITETLFDVVNRRFTTSYKLNLNPRDISTHIKLKDNSKRTILALKVLGENSNTTAKSRRINIFTVQFSAKIRTKVQEMSTKSQHYKLASNAQQLNTST